MEIPWQKFLITGNAQFSSQIFVQNKFCELLMVNISKIYNGAFLKLVAEQQ